MMINRGVPIFLLYHAREAQRHNYMDTAFFVRHGSQCMHDRLPHCHFKRNVPCRDGLISIALCYCCIHSTCWPFACLYTDFRRCCEAGGGRPGGSCRWRYIASIGQWMMMNEGSVLIFEIVEDLAPPVAVPRRGCRRGRLALTKTTKCRSGLCSSHM